MTLRVLSRRSRGKRFVKLVWTRSSGNVIHIIRQTAWLTPIPLGA